MTAIGLFASAAAGLALLSATPALAQPYGYPQNGYPSTAVGGAYGAYGQPSDRAAIDQCARAAEARVNADMGGRGYGGYQPSYGQPGYDGQRYGQVYDPRFPNNGYATGGSARLVSITRVERRSNEPRTYALTDSPLNPVHADQRYDNNASGQTGPRGERTDPYARQPYGNNGFDPYANSDGYGQNGPRGERTDPEYRRQQANNGSAYGNQPYGYANGGAGQADMQFDCRIDYRGAITRLRTSRSDYQRGY